MTTPDLPLLVEPDVLEDTLGHDNLLIVDLSKAETYRPNHNTSDCRRPALIHSRIVSESPPPRHPVPVRVARCRVNETRPWFCSADAQTARPDFLLR